MAGPWEKYQKPATTETAVPSGPWDKYAAPAPATGGDSEYGAPGQQYLKGNDSELLSTLGDTFAGAGKGIVHTLYSPKLANALGSVPFVGNYLAPKEGREAMQNGALSPKNGPQQAGYTGEQIAEWLVPAGGEKKGAELLSAHAPQLGRYAAPVGRILGTTAETAARNASQGGSPGIGALAGAAGGTLSEGLRLAAPRMAEMSLGIPKIKRANGATPGEAILSETTATKPEGVFRQASDKLSDLNSELDRRAAASTTPVTMQPARDVVDQSIGEAVNQNSPSNLKKLNSVKNQLTIQHGPSGKPNMVSAPGPAPKGGVAPLVPQPIPVDVPATQARSLKQGVGEEVKNWMAENPKLAEATKERVYGAINGPFHAAVPGAAELDQRMSSLIPVRDFAERRAYGEGVAERALHRFVPHTGALAGAVGGAYGGYQHGGLPVAITGGALGLILPELMASPQSRMMAARAFTRESSPIIRGFTGSGLQLDRNWLSENQK